MERSLLLSVVSSSLVAGIAGAYLGHWLTYRREKKNRLQEQRIQYLIQAYRAFSKANNNPQLCEVADDLEQAVADIQLLGSPELIHLVQRFSEEFARKQEASLDEVLANIRKDLRNELGESPVSGRIIWLRIGRPLK
jgi:crotonobetainyl-CoA:carnitine CoA-transferase CaiB-like acyl-CoA transferase